MQYGAIAMMDALGFRGIWRRPEVRDDPSVVIDKLVALHASARNYIDKRFGAGDSNFEVDVALLSDTVVLTAAARPEKRETNPTAHDALAVHFVCVHASKIMQLAIEKPPALSYRGCVAFGDFALRDRFVVGPAVDEAAESMEAAQAGVVWLLPSAHRSLAPLFPQLQERTKRPLYVGYEVPLKGGDRFDTLGVSPLNSAADEGECDRMVTTLLETFDLPSIGVQVKRQHTEQFLGYCQEAWFPSES